MAQDFEGITLEERTTAYEGILNQLLLGQQVPLDQIQVLMFGYFRDTEYEPSVGFTALANEVESLNPSLASTLDELATTADSVDEDVVVDTIVQAIPTLGASVGVASSRAAARGITGAAVSGGRSATTRIGAGSAGGQFPLPRLPGGLTSGSIPRSTAAVGSVVSANQGLRNPLTLRAVAQWIRNHKITSGVIGAAGLGVGLNAVDPDGANTSGDTGNVIAGSEFQNRGFLVGQKNAGGVTIVDERTGEVIRVTQEELEASQSSDVSVPGSTLTSELSGDLAAELAALGIDTSLFTGGVLGGFQADPNQLGNIRVGDLGLGQIGVNLRGQPVSQENQQAEDLRVTNPALRRHLEDVTGAPIDTQRNVLPPGGEVSPRAFQEHTNGLTLFQLAAGSSAQFGVPASLVYGIITQESGWDPSAVGDQGRAFGLAQINLDNNPEVTQAQAMDPIFALNWTAQNLREGFTTYGTWEAAALSHRSPAAAAALASEGRFLTQVDAGYVNNVITFAQNTGLGNTIFDLETLANAKVGGGGGPSAPAFVAPDPATLREFAQSAIQDILGREADDEDLESAVSKLTDGYRQAHSIAVGRTRGVSAVDVDPQAQFREGLRESGEGQFRGRARERKDMMGWMADVTQLLNRA